MPQLVLEYSDNVIEKNNLKALLRSFHDVLANLLPAELSHCKSHAVERDVYCVGDGSPSNAFVHLTLQVKPGRTDETLKQVVDALMPNMQTHFAQSLQKLNLQITLELNELPGLYIKSSQ